MQGGRCAKRKNKNMLMGKGQGSGSPVTIFSGELGLMYMMKFLEKTRDKIMHFLFPFVARFFLVVSLGLFLAASAVPAPYWQIKMVLFWLWFVNNGIYSSGTMERDYLPIQPGSSPFYHIYRFINGVFFLFLLVFLAVLLLPELLWLKTVFLAVFVMAAVLCAIGNRKYRPKKPEE